MVVVVIPFNTNRYMALCSMLLNQELVFFFVPILCAMFLLRCLSTGFLFLVLVFLPS